MCLGVCWLFSFLWVRLACVWLLFDGLDCWCYYLRFVALGFVLDFGLLCDLRLFCVCWHCISGLVGRVFVGLW